MDEAHITQPPIRLRFWGVLLSAGNTWTNSAGRLVTRWMQHIDNKQSMNLCMTADAMACARLKSSWRCRTLRVPSSRILLKQPEERLEDGSRKTDLPIPSSIADEKLHYHEFLHQLARLASAASVDCNKCDNCCLV